MPDIYQDVSRIQTLAYELVQKYEDVLNENEVLKNRLNDLEEQHDKSGAMLSKMEKDLQLARTARGLSGDDDADLAKAKINTLVREIDRCIALLNE